MRDLADLAVPSYWYTKGLSGAGGRGGVEGGCWSLVDVTRDGDLIKQLQEYQDLMMTTKKTPRGYAVKTVWHVENARL